MFTVTHQDKETNARAGFFVTRHGRVNTPAFFPVATQAAVKGLSPKDLSEIGIEGLLVNAYHVSLRPGVDVIKKSGGLHAFMNFGGTIITDSGGYQIFSLEGLRKVSDDGVQFQSHFDGKTFFLTPEDVVKIQVEIQTDVVVPLDECVKYPALRHDAERSVKRTITWLKRSRDFFQIHQHQGALFFGIVQGSTFLDLREQCFNEAIKCGLDGVCLGGLSVGEPEDLRYNILSFLQKQMPPEYLRYFMGYGMPRDIVEAVSLGVDLFDCVVPTRFARTGTAFTNKGRIIIRDAPYTQDFGPIDEECGCFVCRNYSRAYVRHLVNVGELLGIQLLAYHNVFWYKKLMDKIRSAIQEQRFAEFKKDFLAHYKET